MTTTNPIPPTKKLPPFRRYYERGIRTKVLHHIGHVAIGLMLQTHGPVFVGRWRNRFAQHANLSALLAILRSYRAEHKARERAQIGFHDAVAQLLVPVGAIRLFMLTFGLKTTENYSRQTLRRLILSRRGKFTACQLRCLNQIVIHSPTLY